MMQLADKAYNISLINRVIFLLLVLCVANISVASDDALLQKSQLKSLNQGIVKLESWLKNAQTKQYKIQTQLQHSEKEIAKTIRQIRKVTASMKAANTKLIKLRAQKGQLLLDRLKQEKLLAKQLRASYYLGSQAFLKMLLNQEHPEALARILKYHDYFNKARTQQIAVQNTILETLRLNRLAAEEVTQSLKNNKEILLSQQGVQRKQRTKRKIILVQLDQDIKNKDLQLDALRQNRAQLEKLIQEVKKNIPAFNLANNAVPLRKLKGKLPWPTKGKILHRYGSVDRYTGTKWRGMMIKANEGQNVIAVHSGSIVFANWLRGYGLLMIIDHGENYMSLYGHNQALYKEIGDRVNVGEIIAGVGSSGGLHYPNLYFEIRHNGKTQNPQKWIMNTK